MILKELSLNNFLSHESTTINFGETEKLLIDGRSGSGKSSITDAIIWALYGKSRTDSRNLIRRGSKVGTVSLKLADGQSVFCITRSVSDKGKNTLTITKNSGTDGQFLPIETTGLKDSQNWIEKEFLKASYELFTNSIVYPQENENSFVKANASKRKDLLLEIIRAGNFDELYEKAKKFISTKELEIAVIISKITGLETSIKNAAETASKFDFYTETYFKLSEKLKELETSEKILEKELHDISNVVTTIENNKRIIKNSTAWALSLDSTIGLNDKYIREHNLIDPTVFLKDIEKSNILFVEVKEIEKQLQESAISSQIMYNHMANKPQVFDYSKDIAEINKRLILLIKDGSKCPAGDACPYIAPIQGQITYLTEQITEKETKSKQEKEDLAKWQSILNTIPPIKDNTELYNKLKTIQELLSILSKSKEAFDKYIIFKEGLNELNAKQLSLRTQRTEHFKNVKENEEANKALENKLASFDVNNVNIDLSNLRITKQNLQKERDEASLGKQLAINAQETIKKDSAELVIHKDTILKNQNDIECTNLLKEALSPRGIKAVVIDYIVPQLEERINEVLSQMSDFKIRLDTQAPTVDEGVKEGLFITVINDRKEELAFANYSGGEKVKITIAISEALASLMNQIGFRIMDENIVSLDRESTEGFIEVLTRLQNKFPQLLVISHLQEVKDMFEKHITIIKTNGVSKINEIN